VREEERSWWDIAQICLNGHTVNQQVVAERDHNQAFCERCRKATVMAYRHCRTAIRGAYHVPGTYVIDAVALPSYCLGCGRAYPWTEKQVQAAKVLAGELEHLKPQERDALKRTIDDLLTETPRTQLAVIRFKRLMSKAGPDAGITLREMLVNVLSEAVRRAIWGDHLLMH
jgi:hypothetical protein